MSTSPMRCIADLHIHSKYSRACSANLTLSNLGAWARTKGIDVLATADFTHPAWLKEIEEKLEPAEIGLFRLKKKFESEDGSGNYEKAPVPPGGGREPRFILSTELACIYKKGGKTRRLHLVLLMPSLAAVRRLVKELEKREFNLKSDGRPILGMDAADLLSLVLETDPDSLLIPAHAWTPWFSVFGSESGFDSLEECFGTLAPHIHAVETGLSSDPPMNWRLSALDKVTLVSNSDAHGLKNLGREANAVEMGEMSYPAIAEAIRSRDPKRFLYTIEFFPEEGKYHADGHRPCGYSCLPEETERCGGRCPKCGQKTTRGVLGRVASLADRAAGQRPAGAPDFRRIVPLEELIAAALEKGRTAKAVGAAYRSLIEKTGSEFEILLDAPAGKLVAAAGPRIAEAIERMRAGRIRVRPGYDGVFGAVSVFDMDIRSSQGRLGL